MVADSGHPFLDVDQIAAALMERATTAGWTPDDISAAVAKLAENRQSVDKDIHRVEAAH
jgi:hypothetical protein